MGCSGGACSTGLSGTSLLTTGVGINCCARAPNTGNATATMKAVANAAIEILALFFKSRPRRQADARAAKYFLRSLAFFFANHFFDAGAQIFEHHRRGVASWHS